MNQEIAQLRHLYANLVNGGVKDSAAAKRIAEGLLAPAIEALERQSQQIEELFLALEIDRGAANLYAKQVLYWINKNDEKLEEIKALKDDAAQKGGA